MNEKITPLRAARKKMGMTLLQVAEAIKWDVGNLSRVERGLQVADIKRAAALSGLFCGEVGVFEIMYPGFEK